MARHKSYYTPNTIQEWEFPIVRMRPGPPMRKDGLCYVCREPLTQPAGIREGDPFCSNLCARDYFGVPLPLTEGGNPVNRKHHSNTKG